MIDRLLNQLVALYMAEAGLFLEALQAAERAICMLIDLVTRIKQQADMLGIAT